MFRNNYFKMFIFIFAWEPVALKVHWFLEAWRISPLDRFDPVFIVSAVLMAGIFFKDFRQQAGVLTVLKKPTHAGEGFPGIEPQHISQYA